LASLVTTLEPATASRFRALERLIGNTPLLAIDFEFRGRRRTIYAKSEHLNLTGSIKDRMALHILRQAYAEGRLRPGDTLAEATSGNTGIAFAALGRARRAERAFLEAWDDDRPRRRPRQARSRARPSAPVLPPQAAPRHDQSGGREAAAAIRVCRQEARLRSSVPLWRPSAAVGTQFVAEARVFKQAARHVEFVLADQDAAWKNTDRAFQHADILIDHQVFNARAIEQRLDR